MKLRFFAVFVSMAFVLSAQEIPTVLKDASSLELLGKLSEALETYALALNSESIVRSESSFALKMALKKSAFLSIDLGQYENAWDLGARLIALGDQDSLVDGLLAQWRILRSAQKSSAAWELYRLHFSQVKEPPPILLEEALWIAHQEKKSDEEKKLRARFEASSSADKGEWNRLLSPSEASAVVSFTIPKRLQIGAYKDWNNALTQWNSLKDRGWQPFIDRKTTSNGIFFSVFVVTANPQEKLKKLKDSGIEAIVLP